MTVTNVDRGLDVLEALVAAPEGTSLGALADALDLPKAAVYRLLQRLSERGYVCQDPGTQQYALSLKLALLGFRFLDAQRLPDVAQIALDRLANECGEYCRIALVDGNALTWVAWSQGATAGLRYQPPMGREVVLHATATGKAWLSTLPEEEALALAYRRGLGVPPGFGPRAVKNVDALRDQLAQARRRGYAQAIDEGEVGITALATAFRAFDAPDARVVGTVSIAGPSRRLDAAKIRALAPRLVRAAHELGEIWPIRTRQPRDFPREAAPAAAQRTGATR